MHKASLEKVWLVKRSIRMPNHSCSLAMKDWPGIRSRGPNGSSWMRPGVGSSGFITTGGSRPRLRYGLRSSRNEWETVDSATAGAAEDQRREAKDPPLDCIN